ncbi:ETS-related transcription factor Elf-3 isoform X2 [Ascaphus truei]|uniref:ETS-related transcription factor Elf-3 isoform X2 n=1 Tax=Ascaphus truei TaxID=8439 RepID=UPI003F5958E7
MAGGTCEMGSIFNSYFTTLYSLVPANAVPDNIMTTQDRDKFLPFATPELSSILTAETSSWAQDLPAMWSQQQVLDWISYHVEQNKWDASTMDLTQCEMDGQQLCQMDRDEINAMFGGLGEKLYADLCQLRDYSLTDWELINDIIIKDENMMLHEDCLQLGRKKATDIEDWCEHKLLSLKPSDPGYYSDPISPASSESCGSGTVSYSHHTGDSGGSDVDLDVKNHMSKDEFSSYKKTDASHIKRKRGRPRKMNSDSRDMLETKKSKHSARGTHLWEFILYILLHPELFEGLMKWEDREEGVFKFLRSEAVAQLWGQKKKNTSMTYEKLSRAMRYYYKREILDRVDGRRLVYKFGKNSSGWRMGDRGTLGS